MTIEALEQLRDKLVGDKVLDKLTVGVMTQVLD
jgi:hypothetical protein